MAGQCYHETMLDRLRQALIERRKWVNEDTSLKPSAVLLPLFLKDGQYHILYTKRTDKVREHKGQISFPGGAFEAGDTFLLQTALRECAEEIGLKREAVEIIGELDDTPTIGSRYIITTFVGLISWPYEFAIDPFEVDSLLQIPVVWLLKNGGTTEVEDPLKGGLVSTRTYDYNGDVIWGATARITHQFLQVYAGASGEPEQ